MDFQEIKNKVEQERKRKLSEGDVHPKTLTMPQGNAPKDSLLHELQHGLQTGKSTPAIDKMRQVEYSANEKARLKGGVTLKSGGGMSDSLSQHIGQPPRQQPPQQQPPRQQLNEQQQGNPRDAAFDQQFSQGNRQPQNNAGLSQLVDQMGGSNNGYQHPAQHLMEQYQQMGGTNQPMQNQSPQQYQNPQGQQQGRNSNINEQVNEALQNVDFGTLLEKSMKNTVMEMYAMEKMQKSLLENKDMIKKIVKETLIELSQAKKKSNN